MEPNDAASSSARAHELRASLGARREVEALLAEASATREAAVADADAMIEEAQEVSEQLLRESRTEAERTTTDARLRAEGVVGRARTEAEDITRQARAAADAVRARAEAQVEEHRKRVRAELTEQVTREVAEQSRRELARVHERQQSMIGDIEASVRILGVSMEAAVANIAEMLGALDSLRAHTAESLGEASPMNAPPRHADESDDDAGDLDAVGDPSDTGAMRDAGDPDAGDAADVVIDDDDDDDGGEGEDAGDDADPPIGRAARSGHLIDALADLDGGEASAGADDDGSDDDRPLTATEAFLRSAHIDHGDPPLPPMDDGDIGARYARDAMRATARGRARRDKETLEVLPERNSTHRPGRNGKAVPDERVAGDGDEVEGDDGEASGKPLGWLFRSSQ
jgi:cell division septum initiation protein DivIVA